MAMHLAGVQGDRSGFHLFFSEDPYGMLFWPLFFLYMSGHNTQL